jgi:hypothetical protein
MEEPPSRNSGAYVSYTVMPGECDPLPSNDLKVLLAGAATLDEANEYYARLAYGADGSQHGHNHTGAKGASTDINLFYDLAFAGNYLLLSALVDKGVCPSARSKESINYTPLDMLALCTRSRDKDGVVDIDFRVLLEKIFEKGGKFSQWEETIAPALVINHGFQEGYLAKTIGNAELAKKVVSDIAARNASGVRDR